MSEKLVLKLKNKREVVLSHPPYNWTIGDSGVINLSKDREDGKLVLKGFSTSQWEHYTIIKDGEEKEDVGGSK